MDGNEWYLLICMLVVNVLEFLGTVITAIMQARQFRSECCGSIMDVRNSANSREEHRESDKGDNDGNV